MRHIKKLMAAVLVAVMALALGSALAFADETGSITVTGQKYPAGESSTTYEVYKIFDLTPTTDGNGDPVMGTEGGDPDEEHYSGVRYTIDEDWSGFFASGAAGAAYIVDNQSTGGSLPQIVVGGVTKYINITESNVAAFARAAFAWSQAQGLEADASNTTGVFTGLELGYYMVYPKGANLNVGDYTSIVSLTSTNPDQEIVQKAEYPTLVKTDDDASVEVGQTVNYEVTTKVPDMNGFDSFDFWVNDTMSTGLTFDGASSVAVKIGDEDFDDFTVAVDPSNSNRFTVKLDLFNNKSSLTVGDEIVVSYTATVNSNAVTKVEKNSATLEYSNNPQDGTEHTTTPPSETKVWSAKIVIDKVDGSNTATKLEGAKFVLKCKSVTETATDDTKPTATVNGFYACNATDGTVTWVEGVTDADLASETAATAKGLYIAETDENGATSFEGLEAGTYELYEIVAPDGYNKIEGVAATITVNSYDSESDDAAAVQLTSTQQVQNNAGSVLPSTGGMGTTILYTVGAILVIGAVVLLITRRRMNNEK